MARTRQPIKVLAAFWAGKVRPVQLSLDGRTYVVERLDLLFERGSGDARERCFCVWDGANMWQLAYHLRSTEWFLEETPQI